MSEPVRLGIIICDRYRTCAGGKCIRALKNREGAFHRYQGIDVELVGYTTCGGCPGGNLEYAPAEMSVSATLGGPRMGPIFGGMLLSGKRCAEAILGSLPAPPHPREPVP